MISLIVGVITHRKYWSFYEILDHVDKTLSKDFSIITPRKVARTMIMSVLTGVNLVLFLLVAITYYVYESLEIPSLMLSLSYYAANLPYAAVVTQFCFSTAAIEKRFYYINNIFRQLASNDIPKVFDICARNEKNERHTPTISLQEIYTVYGGHHMRKNISSRGVNVKEEFNREIKKLTMQLEKRDESLIEQYKRKDVIEVQEFKITKLSSVETVMEHLTKLVDIHDELLDAISLHNQILAFQVLMIFGQIFSFSVITFFSLYRSLFHPQANILAYTNIFWIFLYTFILIVVMNSASSCVYEGKFTGTAVHKVINKLSNYNNVDFRIIDRVMFFRTQFMLDLERNFYILFFFTLFISTALSHKSSANYANT
jgi:hypothetical protein